MRNQKWNFLRVLIMFAMGALLMGLGVPTQAQKARASAAKASEAVQQPLYTEYKGVRLGMTAQEVRTKLGEPTLPALKENEPDYFVISETEAAQIGYDAARRVKVISVDYQNGVGAPEPSVVVGAPLETQENGSQFRVARYENLRLWVSYSRTSGVPAIVTITIQKM